jgi:hypothetical protein
MKKLLLVSVLCAPSFLVSTASAQTNPVSLPEDYVLAVDTVVCGFIDRWIPGRLLDNGRFFPTQYEIRKLTRRLAILDSTSGKRNALVRRVRALRKQYKPDLSVCSSISTLPASVTATPTANPSLVGGGIVGGSFKTPTPTTAPTSAGTGTPGLTPGVTETPSVTETPAEGTPTVTPTSTESSAPTLTATPVPDREITNYVSLEGYSVIADDGAFLGIISTSKTANTSIANQNGTYGSRFGALSIFNLSGNYGSVTGIRSAFNKFTTTPPAIYNGSVLVGYLTLNSGVSGQYVNTCKLVNFLGRAADATNQCR